MTTHLARTMEEADALRPVWERFDWTREEAEHAFFLARLRAREGVTGPYALLDEDTRTGFVGRVESAQLPAQVGYRTVYAPRVRLLQVVDGGLAGDPQRLATELRRALSHVDVLKLPPLPVESELFGTLASLAGPLRRQPFIVPWRRRRLALPPSFDEFVASRTPNTRWRIRRHARRVAEAFGDELRVDVISSPQGFEQLVRDADAVAARTYQRALGAGFADTPEQRAIVRVGLEHRWIRAWLLYLGEEPVAYWLCSVHKGVLSIRQTGFDSAYAEHRIGIHLLMRVIADACADDELHAVDFGPGDAAYKQQFSSESWLERNLVLFAPTARALWVNASRTAVLGPARMARRALDAASLTDRVRSGWRERLRR